MHPVALLVSAWLVSAALAQDLLAEAQIQVRNRLRDPESAQFDNLRAAQKTVSEKKVQVVCGNVNARNSTGQLSGPSPFVFLGEMRESWLARNHDIPGQHFACEQFSTRSSNMSPKASPQGKRRALWSKKSRSLEEKRYELAKLRPTKRSLGSAFSHEAALYGTASRESAQNGRTDKNMKGGFGCHIQRRSEAEQITNGRVKQMMLTIAEPVNHQPGAMRAQRGPSV